MAPEASARERSGRDDIALSFSRLLHAAQCIAPYRGSFVGRNKLRRMILRQMICGFGHDAARAAAPARALNSDRFFKCTNNNEIAAGVTPEMRAAWPTVSGRY